MFSQKKTDENGIPEDHTKLSALDTKIDAFSEKNGVLYWRGRRLSNIIAVNFWTLIGGGAVALLTIFSLITSVWVDLMAITSSGDDEPQSTACEYVRNESNGGWTAICVPEIRATR